jgi:hypothetical protein
MNAAASTARRNQIIYAVAILVLFGAMYPYTIWLDRLKTRKELGEATLGQIDTGGFMLKLLLVGGFRGLVADWHWNQAIAYQKVHDWDRMKQTVDTITKLQPHFLSVWTYQGWNLAYNVSVEWDDPADKYEWIKNGIKFIKEGVANNRKSPDLLWDTAWTYYHKIGFSDEAIILRKLFREDEDEAFKYDPIALMDSNIEVPLHDNFQVAHGWFIRSVRLADEGAERVGEGIREVEEQIDTGLDYVDRPVQHKGRQGDLAFRTMPAHAQTRYAIGLEKESIKDYPPTFGDVARDAWEKALAEWLIFGKHSYPAFSHPDQMVQIDDHTNPKVYATLTPEQKYWTERWSNQMNYAYWKDRSVAEGESAGVKCRRLFYEGTRALKEADYRKAVDRYQQGISLWHDLLERHHAYRDDDLNQKDTGALLKRYAFTLKQVGKPVPEDMPFYDLYKKVEHEPIQPDPFDALDMIRSSRRTATPADSGD